MIKALISDFDGTLTDHTHQLNQAVVEAARDFQNQGFIFSIATGRMYQGIVAASAAELSTQTPLIVRGGSEIIDPVSKQVLWGKHINQKDAENLIAFLHTLEEQFKFAAESGEFVYTRKGIVVKEFGAGAQFADLATIPTDKVPKVVLEPASPEPLIDELIENLAQKFPKLHLAKISSRKGFGIDINSHEAGKENALKAWADIMGLTLTEIASVGDGHNDYPLLINCGYKIAMGNAPDSLKKIADLVVGTQAEDGLVEGMKAVAQLQQT